MLVAFVVAVAMVRLCRMLAHRFGLVAKPKEDRWHDRTVALLGGVAIAVTVFAGVLIFRAYHGILVLLGCAALIFLTGLVDDLRSLKPFTKLVIEIAIAGVFVSFGYRLNWTTSLTLDTLLTMVWIVGMTNAFNLLDNMDGLCAGIALVVGGALLFGDLSSAPGPAIANQVIYLQLLIGATAGFLVYNLHPASIFMGDSGSLLLGLSFAALTVSRAQNVQAASNPLSIVAAPVLVLMIPIFDTALVTVSRLLSGRAPSEGGRDHSSHRLVAVGLSERSAVSLLWLLAAIGGALGIGVDYFNLSWSTPAIALFLLSMVIFAAYLLRIRVYGDEDVEAIDRNRITQLSIRFMYKRQVAEVLLDLSLVSIAYYSAYRLRFEGPEFGQNFPMFYRSLPLVLAVQMMALFVAGLYRGVWRYFGLTDTLAIARGVLLGTVAAQLLILQLFQFDSDSRTVFIIYAVLLATLLTGSRTSFRLIRDFLHDQRTTMARVVIYGAGDAGSMAVRELTTRYPGYRIIGFIDDDPNKLRMRVHGHPVVGAYDSLVAMIAGAQVDAVVVSARSIAADRLRDVESLCSSHRVGLSRLNVTLAELLPVDRAPSTDTAAERRLPERPAGVATSGRRKWLPPLN
jgi:UDP-GlcNAc:undecaprenyl-phosphate GlcNAc-1-phosphate transferase